MIPALEWASKRPIKLKCNHDASGMHLEAEVDAHGGVHMFQIGTKCEEIYLNQDRAEQLRKWLNLNYGETP